MKRKLLIGYLITCLALMLNFACKEKPTTPSDSTTTIKSISGFSASTSLQVTQKIWAAALLMPNSATYADGWWTFTVDLPNGSNGQMHVQFQDSSSTVQKFYNPQLTYTILGKGLAQGAKGSLDYSVRLSGTTLTSGYIITNGNGSVTYLGATAVVNITNLKMLKLPNSYPIEGSITIVTLGSTVTVTFNGTKFAQGTFTYGGSTYNFSIDLDTGAIG